MLGAQMSGNLFILFSEFFYPICSKVLLNFPILHGLTPMDVHFLVQKIPTSSLPTNDKELAEWLKDRWEEKGKSRRN